MSVRFFRHFCGSALLAAFVAACGGAMFSPRDDGANGGSSSGGKSSQGASSSIAGATAKGGSTSGGSTSVGGTRATAGTTSTAGSGVGGSMNCQAVDCAYPLCSDGQMPVTYPGQCCPTCPPPLQGCANVVCQPVMACPAGYTISQPPGACCEGCVPKQGGVACPEIACPPSDCPLGYVRGDTVGGCCSDCVPDRLFCNDDSECVVADRPRSCCGCPELVTRREYDADPCWSDVDMPRPIPKACYPEVTCGAICAACPPPLDAVCDNHHCAQIGLK
jgi:hypothetical protein